MTMKKIILIFLMMLVFSGCGGEAKEMPETSTNDDEVQTVEMAKNKIIQIQIGGQTFQAALEDNPTVEEFIKQLPLEIELEELNGNEKFYHFNERFSTSDIKPKMIHTGDLMLYSGSYFVLFYKDFDTNYSYTRLGKIENVEGLLEAVGESNIRVKINSN